MQGGWILLFNSAVSHGCLALEANLSQVGNHVVSDRNSALIFQPKNCNTTLEMELKRLGGECDSGSVGDVTVDATLSSGAVSLNLSETGTLGSVVTTASASSKAGTALMELIPLLPPAAFPKITGRSWAITIPLHFQAKPTLEL
jgi:hypothetical protein